MQEVGRRGFGGFRGPAIFVGGRSRGQASRLAGAAPRPERGRANGSSPREPRSIGTAWSVEDLSGRKHVFVTKHVRSSRGRRDQVHGPPASTPDAHSSARGVQIGRKFGRRHDPARSPRATRRGKSPASLALVARGEPPAARGLRQGRQATRVRPISRPWSVSDVGGAGCVGGACRRRSKNGPPGQLGAHPNETAEFDPCNTFRLRVEGRRGSGRGETCQPPQGGECSFPSARAQAARSPASGPQQALEAGDHLRSPPDGPEVKHGIPPPGTPSQRVSGQGIAWLLDLPPRPEGPAQ